MKHVFSAKLRRALALALALLLTTALFGCQKKNKGDSSEPPLQSNPTAAPTETPTQAPTEAPTEAPEETTQPQRDPVMGTVSATKLNIRASDSFDAESVGFYYEDDRVELLEIKGAWGRTDLGWVSMEYIIVDGQTGQNNQDDQKDTQKDNNNTQNQDDEEETVDEELITDGKTTVLGNGVVTIGSLNVRSGPGTKYGVLSKYSLGERLAYYQTSGNWVRTNKGWISKTYFYIEGNSGEGAGNGTVTASELNIRTGPGTGYSSNGKYEKGASVKILAQVNGWGYTSKGWVKMEYVKMEGQTDSNSGTSGSYKTGTGTVTGSELNIRKDAKLDAERVGSYKKGDKVNILEVKGEWGRTDKGWINLKYVKMDSGSNSGSNSDSSTTYKTGNGTVTANGGLNIRKEANTTSTVLGSYKKGDKVNILEVKGEWGRTDKGWINLKYVKMD